MLKKNFIFVYLVVVSTLVESSRSPVEKENDALLQEIPKTPRLLKRSPCIIGTRYRTRRCGRRRGRGVTSADIEVSYRGAGSKENPKIPKPNTEDKFLITLP